MKITKKQIFDSMQKADAFGPAIIDCDKCWIHHLIRITDLVIEDHPCSKAVTLLNQQYHTKYYIKPGCCEVQCLPRKGILSKVSFRFVKV